MTANNRTLTDSLIYTSVMSQELNPQSQQCCTLVMTSVHFVNILRYIIYMSLFTHFTLQALHIPHYIIYIL